MLKPNKVLFQNKYHRPKIFWLARGFAELGSQVVYSDRLEKQIPMAGVEPFDLIFENFTLRAWLDTMPTPEICEKIFPLQGNAYYFKTHLNFMMRFWKPKLFPMPNSGSNEKFMDKLSELRKTRNEEPLYDIIAILCNSDNGLRIKTCELIQDNFDSAIVGIYESPFYGIDRVPTRLKREKMPYDLYLHLISRSKLALAMPAINNPKAEAVWCSFRLVENLGIGTPTVTIENSHNYIMVGEPEKCWIECKEDLSDMIEKIKFYLEDSAEREEIGRQGKAYFDSFLSPRKHAEWILNCIDKDMRSE